CGFRMWTAPYLQEHFGSIDLIACIRMSGLLMRSHMNAGQDGFRYACSKRRCDLLMAIGIHGLSHISDRSIPHTTCLFPASSGISPAR
ncbi:hypothetical protein, partial [Novosphingobium sp. ZW T3_23]|uniref:hypothetical protein n=1 Tax=Novosphingobium sp. ZW T3_23 TaxID=3378084 RepID=UPI003851AC05